MEVAVMHPVLPDLEMSATFGVLMAVKMELIIGLMLEVMLVVLPNVLLLLEEISMTADQPTASSLSFD
jgi:hypothetical protein